MVPACDQPHKPPQKLRAGGRPVGIHGAGAVLFNSFDLLVAEARAIFRFFQGGGRVVGVREGTSSLFRVSRAPPSVARANRSL